jgi:hypothetical protein
LGSIIDGERFDESRIIDRLSVRANDETDSKGTFRKLTSKSLTRAAARLIAVSISAIADPAIVVLRGLFARSRSMYNDNADDR